MRVAVLTLVLTAVLAGAAHAGPPRFSGNHSVPIRTTPLYDEARYGEFLPHSDPRGAFSTYGVAYPRPSYRSGTEPVNPPTPTYSRHGG